MKVKIQENYANQFLTTVRGYTLKKNEIKDADLSDKELLSYLDQGIVVVVTNEQYEHWLKSVDEEKEQERIQKENLQKEFKKHDVDEKEVKEKMIIKDEVPTGAIKEVVSTENKPQEQLNEVMDKEAPESFEETSNEVN